jgi:hypothetical protein
MKKSIVSFIVFVSAANFALADAPEWTKQMSQSQNGSVFTSVCEGDGPSADLARMDAIRHCKASAAEQLGTKVQVQSLSVRSDNSAGFHQEISQSGNYEGLICSPKNTYTQPEDGHYRFWIQCEFDLSKAKLATGDANQESAAQAHTAEERVGALSSSTRDVKKLKSTAAYDQSETRTVSIISVPACEDMMIQGPKARVIKCHDNPNDVGTFGEDTDILVRRAGYASKTVSLSDLRTASLTTVTVVMDPL